MHVQHPGIVLTELLDLASLTTFRQRTLIQGYYLEGRSPKWLAEKGNQTVEAVYKSIQRARRDLQFCIEHQTRKDLL